VRKQSIARPIECAAQRDLQIAQTDRSRVILVIQYRVAPNGLIYRHSSFIFKFILCQFMSDLLLKLLVSLAITTQISKLFHLLTAMLYYAWANMIKTSLF